MSSVCISVELGSRHRVSLALESKPVFKCKQTFLSSVSSVSLNASGPLNNTEQFDEVSAAESSFNPMIVILEIASMMNCCL